MSSTSIGLLSAVFFGACLNFWQVEAYLVGAGLNVRFSQLLHSDPKWQALREDMIKVNTRGISHNCHGDGAVCDNALARTRRRPSKHFYNLAKAVVAYMKSESTAKPSGYVGTAMFCTDTTCIQDMDPPIVYGGCREFISCGGDKAWRLVKINGEFIK